MTNNIKTYKDDLGNVTCIEHVNERGHVVKRIIDDFVEDFIRNEDGILIGYKDSNGYSYNLNKQSIDEVIEEHNNNTQSFLSKYENNKTL